MLSTARGLNNATKFATLCYRNRASFVDSKFKRSHVTVIDANNIPDLLRRMRETEDEKIKTMVWNQIMTAEPEIQGRVHAEGRFDSIDLFMFGVGCLMGGLIGGCGLSSVVVHEWRSWQEWWKEERRPMEVSNAAMLCSWGMDSRTIFDLYEGQVILGSLLASAMNESTSEEEFQAYQSALVAHEGFLGHPGTTTKYAPLYKKESGSAETSTSSNMAKTHELSQK